MPMFKVKVSRTAVEVAEVYVYADTKDSARDNVAPDITDIVEAYSGWDLDDFASDHPDIDSVTEVEKLPRLWTIPEELDFRTPETQEEDLGPPIPDDPRQTKLDFTR